LLDLGEEVVLVPIYTPLRTDEPNVSQQRVFFGGINAYLQQKLPLFRHTPPWLDRWLDHPALLRLLSGRGASVDPAQLGALTVSMLQGELGNQRKELDQLVDWLCDQLQPDIIHFSNSMMLGLARTIQQRGGPPVVCSLSGEDLFLEKLRPPYYQQARELLRERAAEVEAFTALNQYYADFMADYLSVPREKITVIPHGLRLEGHHPRPPAPAMAPFRIGFLARVCKDKGLHLLVEACERIVQHHHLENFQLHAAGFLGAGDRPYLQQLQTRAQQGVLAGKFHHLGELDRDQKIAFLQTLDVLSTPTLYPESKGLPLLEALANAVPVVVPAHGTYPELIAETGGGLLFDPGDAASLAEKLVELYGNRERAHALGMAGHRAIHLRYHAQAMAQQTCSLYQELV
jgi:glycosyltransferase involved in cell wall biosynthesis